MTVDLVALLAAPPTAAAVLALLDAYAARAVAGHDVWPSALGRTHGRRAIAARHGDAWGLAIEQIEGERPGAVLAPRIAVFGFGPKAGKRGNGAQVVARPLQVTGAPVHPNPYADWIAARLASKPEALWGPPTACLAALGLPKDATIVAVVPRLVLGDGPPSASDDLRALAAALEGANAD